MTHEAETKWLPESWLDESTPDLQPHPDNFIDIAAGGFVLRPAIGDPDRDGEFFCMPVEPGQIVGFIAHRYYGNFDLTVLDDGGYASLSGLPADANVYRLGYDNDTIENTIEALIETGGDDGALQAGTYEIDASHWSDPISFRFEVEDGRARFVQCAGAS